MVSPSEHFAVRALRWLAQVVGRYRPWFVYPQLALAVLCVVYTARHLKFDMSRDNLVGAEKRYHQNFLKFKKEFPLQDDLVVVLESENREKNRQFVERLGARLDQETNLFTDVVYRGDLRMLGPKALLFVPEPELEALLKTLRDFEPFLDRFSRTTNLLSLLDLVNQQFLRARPEQSAENESLARAIPALERILALAADALRRGGTPPSPGVEALFGGGKEAENQSYIAFAGGRIYLVTARAASRDLNEEAVARLRELVALTQREVPGLNVGVTGEPVLELDEMEQSEKDTILASAIAFVLVLIIILYGYSEVTRRLKADFCLLIGLAYTMAFTTFVVGHLNILTVTFAPILIGLAIDFGVHLISRYEEELGRGQPQQAAMEKAMVYTGMGIFTGGFTTAGAFLAMCATDFKGIQEMGVISGGGLVVCLVPMMTLLPAMLLRRKPSAPVPAAAAGADRRERVERLWLNRPRLVVMITVSLCVAAAIPLPKVFFDYNLLNMQSAGLPAVLAEKKLIASASKSVLFGAIIVDSLDQAVAMQQRLTNLSTVASVELGGVDNLITCLTEDQTRKLALVRQISDEAARIRFPSPDGGPLRLPELQRALFILQGYVTLAMDRVRAEEPELCRQLDLLGQAAVMLREQIHLHPAERVAGTLLAYQVALFEDVRSTFAAMQNQDASARLAVGDLPPLLRNRFLGVTGKYLLQVYPRKDVWQRQNQKEFVDQLRWVDPDATGTPVQLYQYTTLLKQSYQQAAGYSLLAILLLVMLHFRSLLCVLLALAPVAIGTLWMVGFMGLMEVPFNPANIMTLPLVIGVGVTNGIHILNRFAEEHTPSILARSTGRAVLVSGLTTVAGFGSLIIAKHRGIASLGLIMSFGTATCMIAGLTFLPALLTLLTRRGWGVKKKPRGDNALSPAGSGGTTSPISNLSKNNYQTGEMST